MGWEGLIVYKIAWVDRYTGVDDKNSNILKKLRKNLIICPEAVIFGSST